MDSIGVVLNEVTNGRCVCTHGACAKQREGGTRDGDAAPVGRRESARRRAEVNRHKRDDKFTKFAKGTYKVIETRVGLSRDDYGMGLDYADHKGWSCSLYGEQGY